VISLKGFFSWLQPDPQPFTLREFMAQMGQVEKLGPMSKVMRVIPGMRKLVEQMQITEDEVEQQMMRMRAIYCSMSDDERLDPDRLNGSRRSRIAAGAGVHTRAVVQFVRQFELSREMIDRIRWGR
jgi:signal recognition particle subunit SRP54